MIIADLDFVTIGTISENDCQIEVFPSILASWSHICVVLTFLVNFMLCGLATVCHFDVSSRETITKNMAALFFSEILYRLGD